MGESFDGLGKLVSIFGPRPWPSAQLATARITCKAHGCPSRVKRTPFTLRRSKVRPVVVYLSFASNCNLRCRLGFLLAGTHSQKNSAEKLFGEFLVQTE